MCVCVSVCERVCACACVFYPPTCMSSPYCCCYGCWLGVKVLSWCLCPSQPHQESQHAAAWVGTCCYCPPCYSLSLPG